MLIHHTDHLPLITRLEDQMLNGQPPAYFECLRALDVLELHLLEPLASPDESRQIADLRERARWLHQQLTDAAQACIDRLVDEICSGLLPPVMLKQRFNQYAASLDPLADDQPDYDLFDDFLGALFEVDYEPSETRRRTAEMYYQQPTPARVVLSLINRLPFAEADRFYDIGSGLGNVPLLVSLLTGARSVGVEYEPTYVHYARCAAHKLGISGIEFRNLDAQEADLSDGTIFFMYSPFTGSILRNVLDTLHGISQMHRITLCSYGPCTPLIAQERWLAPVDHRQGALYRLAIFESIGQP